MLTQEQLETLADLLDWVRGELHALEDDFGIEDFYGWRVYREAEETIDHLIEISSAGNRAQQIEVNP